MIPTTGYEWLVSTFPRDKHTHVIDSWKDVDIMATTLDGKWKDTSDVYTIVITGVVMFRLARVSAWKIV